MLFPPLAILLSFIFLQCIYHYCMIYVIRYHIYFTLLYIFQYTVYYYYMPIDNSHLF